jgi:hypothetical protein
MQKQVARSVVTWTYFIAVITKNGWNKTIKRAFSYSYEHAMYFTKII